MSRLYRPESVSRLGVVLFTAAGAAADQAQATVRSLVTSSLMGHDSHGVIRVPEYLGFIASGTLVVNAPLDVERTGPATAVVDCHHGFGAVGAEKAIREGIAIARSQRTASVVTRRCNHVGRLGAWVELAADEGMLALATCNSPIHGHYVLPWGGRDGRLATNPIAYAIPTGGDPVVADFSTSVAPEGKIRVARNVGKTVPDGWIVDANGNATNDPNAFYGPPRGGVLPLGGAAGHKGSALGLFVEILGSALAGINSRDPQVKGNGVCFIVVDPSAFCPLEQFRRLVDDTVAYIKSSRPAPGFDEVLVPGELEFRTLRQRQIAGIPVDLATVEAMRKHGDRLGVDVDEILNAEGKE
ncbi:MAG TPA: Ldh family oxidoreductase [Isosphaeraceae bacterium]|nr:Ldh family oxidoreductase [Isosphaeraceae bacterium]